MSEKGNKPNIELRSEDVQDILNRPPNWMISWGNTLLIIIILTGLLLSYFIKYPDVITGRATISTDIPPVYVVSNVSGRLKSIDAPNGGDVLEGQLLAEIENPTPYSTIDSLQNFLKNALAFLSDSTNDSFKYYAEIKLYEVSSEFLSLKNSLEEYHAHIFSNFKDQQLIDLQNKLAAYEKLNEISKVEAELSKADISYAKERFNMKEEEYELGLISKLEFLNAQSTYNQYLKTEEGLKKNQIQMELTIADYESQIRNHQLEKKAKSKEYRKNILASIATLEHFIIRWETEFTIKSPISGRLDYSGRIKVNQLIKGGDRLFAIILATGSFETLVELPAQGFGKVEVGQKVKLKLDNYPHNEYGFINGTISSLASLPNEDIYQVQLTLDNKLVTSYGTELEYSPEMMATAEVITKDLRLIERLFNSLKMLFE